MNMTLAELKRKNAVSIYRSILDGYNTIISISKVTGISQLTICELANEMVKKELLDMTIPKREAKGRRAHCFLPSHRYFTAFIDVQKDYICTIGISTSGSVVERFDFPINYEGKSTNDVIKEFVISKLKNSPNFKYCLAIYLLTDDTVSYDIDASVTKITKEELIASAFSDRNKAILFDFSGKYIVSLYSHNYSPTADKNTLISAIPFDEICTYEGDLYFDSFDALQKIAMKNLENII